MVKHLREMLRSLLLWSSMFFMDGEGALEMHWSLIVKHQITINTLGLFSFNYTYALYKEEDPPL